MLLMRLKRRAEGCLFMFKTKFLSRDQWLERDRIVTALNEEAKDVVNYWEGHAGLQRGAWHVFSEDQTLPVEQFQRESEVAA
jgi:hypothetical protein